MHETNRSTFHQLKNNGFHHILPIIPAGATISSWSRTLQGKEGILGKTPGRRVSDGWVGLKDWTSVEATDEDLTEWAQSGAGVGLRCHEVIALDIDITNEMLAEMVEREAYLRLGFAPQRIGNAPKRLLAYKADTPGALSSKVRLPLTDWTETEHAVEVLGDRQQFVVEGVHPKTGQPYEWDQPLADMRLDDLPEVTVAEVEDFLAEVSDLLEVFDCTVGKAQESHGAESSKSADMLAGDIDVLRETVAAIPNPEDTTREQFVSMAHAVRAAAGDAVDEGREIFCEWADRWPPGQNPGEPERVYDSVEESGIGIQWLRDQARAAGHDDVADDFGAEVVTETPPLEWSPEEGDGSLFGSWVYVNKLKRFHHLRLGLELDKEQFNDYHREPSQEEKPADVFLERQKPHSFADEITYRPGTTARVLRDDRSGRRQLNTWRPGPAYDEWHPDVAGKVADEDVAPWLALGRHIIPDERERNIVLDWIAALLQRPGVKPNWHPLIGSPIHGIGKDSFFQPLLHGLGEDNVTVVHTEDLEGQWTDWAEGNQLVVVSEIGSFERRSVMNRLKSHMATPPETVRINRKGLPQYKVPNLFGMLMFTNNSDAAALEKHDRRFFVIWSEVEPLDPDFYRYFNTEWLPNGGWQAVVQWLWQRDISAFDHRGNAPDTAAKEEMHRAALPPAEAMLVDGIESEAGPFAQDLLTVAEAHDWLRAHIPRPPTVAKLPHMLQAVGAQRLGRVRVGGGEGRQSLWSVRRHEMYRQAVETAGLTTVRDQLMKQREERGGATADFETGVRNG